MTETKNLKTGTGVEVSDEHKSTRGDAIRFNKGKLLYELVNPKAHADMVNVLTVGANKYFPRNWENGFSWCSVLASLKRHITAFEDGEDYDQETGLLHISHAACNVHFLNSFYYIFPQGDDRPKRGIPKIGVDVDDVLASFIDAWCEKFNVEKPKFWNFDRNMSKKFKKMDENNELFDFYLGLKPNINPDLMPFEPHCYITSRPVPTEVTERWIDDNGFPQSPVYTVPLGESKVEAAKASGVDVFVDDSYRNFKELNENGITCFLYDRPHNQRYDVGYMRIKTLNDLPWFKK